MQIAQWQTNNIGDNNYYNEIEEPNIKNIEKTIFNGSAQEKQLSISGGFKAGICYQLPSLRFKCNNGSVIITVKLMNDINNDTDYQIINSFSLLQGTAFTPDNMVFIPKKDFKYIICEISRDISNSNYTFTVSNDTSGKVCEVTNILNILKTKYTDLKAIVKLGVQGVPGLKMVFNGELVKLGKSGIYTISDVNLDFIGFIVQLPEIETQPVPFNDNINFFIMDFIYEKTEREV